MRNLEQLRATHALAFYKDVRASDLGGEDDGDVVRGLPALIISNGLLATLAFAQMKGRGYGTYATAIARYLAAPLPEGPGLVPPSAADTRSLLAHLGAADSLALQRATAEALAYLGYLKRLAPRG